MITRTLASILLSAAIALTMPACNSNPPGTSSAPAPPPGGPGAGAPMGQSGQAGQFSPQGGMADKIRMAQEALKVDPKNVNMLVELGNLMMDSSRFAEAADAYEKALAINPANSDVRVDMGTCFRNSGNPKRAVEEYNKAITYQPNHANARLNLGVVLAFDFKDTAAAVKVWEEFLKLAPGHQMAPQIQQEVANMKMAKK
ncbi:MAG: tetratricopeptide repeat protein [Nitrospirae bacterium]|nr:tetratricopeptide repeat protein [Nitrospirota bacterium]